MTFMSQLPFARYNRSLASLPLAKKLHFSETTLPHHADADEVLEDGELSYEELRGDLLTIAWNNHEMTALEVVDMNGDPVNLDDEMYYDADDEVRCTRARFCAMSSCEQNRFITLMKMRICAMIGVSHHFWEPSDEFILEIIEDETPEAAIHEMARAAYLATPLPPEDNPSDKDVCPGRDEDADLIRISQYSRERGLNNIGWRNLHSLLDRREYRRGPRKMKSRRPRSFSINRQSHYPKHGRQDYRHQAPRIEARADRRIAANEAWMEAYCQAAHFDFWDNVAKNEANLTDEDYYFLSLRGYEDEVARMEEMARDFGHTLDDPCDVAGTRGYMPWDFERRGYYGPDRFVGYDPFFDDHDPYGDYGYDDRWYDETPQDIPCNSAVCTGESEYRHWTDRFDCDNDMRIFEDYRQSEAYLDTMQFGQSNSKRGRSRFHYYETAQRRAAELV